MTLKEIASGKLARIKVFEDEDGVCVFREFLTGLPAKDRKKLMNLFNRFCEFGEIRNEEKFIHECNDLFCFKSHQVRITCFFLGGQGMKTLVLLHGFIKKQNRTKPEEFKRANEIRVSVIKSIERNQS